MNTTTTEIADNIFRISTFIEEAGMSFNQILIPPHALDDGDVVDLGDKRVRYLATPHVPHGWESGLLFEETTSTLLCGDLFTQMGDGPAYSGNGGRWLRDLAADYSRRSKTDR